MVAVSRITLLVAVVSVVLIARTGYLGGQIRHTEITNAPAAEQSTRSQEEGENDE